LSVPSFAPTHSSPSQARVDSLLRAQNEVITQFLVDAHVQLEARKVPVLDVCGRPKNLASIFAKLQKRTDSGAPRVRREEGRASTTAVLAT